MKNQIVTYIKPGQRDLPTTGLKLHNPGCRMLRKTAARPYTVPRTATKQEMLTHEQCRLC